MLKRQCQLTTLEDVKMEALHNYIDGNLPTLILVDIFTSQLNGARDRVKQFANELRNDWNEEMRREELKEMPAELENAADEDGEEEDLGDDVDDREGPENSGDVDGDGEQDGDEDGDGEQDGDEDGDGEEEEHVEEEGDEDEEAATDDPESPDLRERPSEFFIDKRRKLNPPAEAS